MKLVAIDYGRRRIGMAVVASLDGIACGLETISYTDFDSAVKAVSTVITEEAPERIAMGLPLGKDDQETAMSQEIRVFAAALSSSLPCEIHFIDESFSSNRATQALHHRKKSDRRKKTGNIDKVAACLILEAYQQELLYESAQNKS